MGKTARTPMSNALQIVLDRAKTYVARRKYVQVYVFSTFQTEISALTHAFGGRAYRHGSGEQWILAQRALLEELAQKCITAGGSANLIEEVILKHYPSNKKEPE